MSARGRGKSFVLIPLDFIMNGFQTCFFNHLSPELAAKNSAENQPMLTGSLRTEGPSLVHACSRECWPLTRIAAKKAAQLRLKRRQQPPQAVILSNHTESLRLVNLLHCSQQRVGGTWSEGKTTVNLSLVILCHPLKGGQEQLLPCGYSYKSGAPAE